MGEGVPTYEAGLLRLQRVKDALKASLGRGPYDYWVMFRPQGGTGYGGSPRSRWCVYPVNDDKDPAYKNGLWFDNETVAAAVLGWKQQRAALRPGWIVRAAVKLWRALPWR